MNGRGLSHNLPLIPMAMELIAMGHEITYFAHKQVLPILQPLGCKVMVYDLEDAYLKALVDCTTLLPELLEYFKYVSNFSQV
jgi:UDP:flavonoid glycosyltransferase YjiC (YdhE family)